MQSSNQSGYGSIMASPRKLRKAEVRSLVRANSSLYESERDGPSRSSRLVMITFCVAIMLMFLPLEEALLATTVLSWQWLIHPLTITTQKPC